VVVGTFFVLLELVWRGEIRVYQHEEYGRIFIKRRGKDYGEGVDGDGEGGENGEGEKLPPAMPHVEPHLPPPIERRIGPDGKVIRVASRTRFGGLDNAEGAEGRADVFDEDAIAADNFEVRLKARIERILKLADDICERFEQSLKTGPPSASAEGTPPPAASTDLDAELAAFQDELGPEEDDDPEGPDDPEAADTSDDAEPTEDVDEMAAEDLAEDTEMEASAEADADQAEIPDEDVGA
jgi:hypothetical protein